MAPRDTTKQAYEIQLAAIRALTPAERFKAAIELSDFTHRLAAAGLRVRRPDCTDENVNRLLAETLFPIKREHR